MTAETTRKINVLYVVHDTLIFGGAARSLCDLVASVSHQVNPVFLLLQPGKFETYLKDNGYKYYVQPFQSLIVRHKDWRYYLRLPKIYISYMSRERRNARALAQRLSGEHIDIVHSNSSIFTFGLSLARALGAKHVWHVREYMDLDFGYQVLCGRSRLRRLINGTEASIAISQSVKSHWGLTSPHCHVIYDAVGHGVASRPVLRKEKYILFCAANITERKGVFRCVEAFALSGIHRSGYRLRIVGHVDDSIRSRLQQSIKNLGMADYVDLVEYQDHLDDVFSRATAFVMASEAEALGRVTVEAMRAGCPVIGYATGATREIVEHGVTGYLFSGIEDCAAIMREVVASDNTDMIRNAAKYAELTFSDQSYGSSVMNVYKSVLR